MSEKTPAEETRATPLPPPRPASLSLQLLLGILIFACGIGVGVGGVVIFGREWMLRDIRRPPDPRQAAHDLTEGLGLTPEKRTEVEAIIVRHIETGGELREEHLQQVMEDMKLMEDEVAQVLDAETARKWRQRIEELPPLGRGGHRGPPPEHHGGPPSRDGRPPPRGRH